MSPAATTIALVAVGVLAVVLWVYAPCWAWGALHPSRCDSYFAQDGGP